MALKIGLVQSRGIGDIIIALPIAKYYHDRGCEVLWPIDERFMSSFGQAVDYVNFIPFRFDNTVQTFVNTPIELLKRAGCSKIVTLYSFMSKANVSNQAFFNSLKFDEYKYAIAGVPFREKWKLSIRRNPEREASLYKELVKQEDYVVVHRKGSNFQININIPPKYKQCQCIEIGEKTDNIFDWLGILEKARLLIMVDSCFSNLVDQLGFENEKLYVLRSDVRFTPVLRGNWRYYGDSSALSL